MIFAFPGQNNAFAGEFRLSYDTLVGGSFAAGQKLHGSTAQAWIREVNATLGYLECISVKGFFTPGETIFGRNAVYGGALETGGADIGADDTVTGVSAMVVAVTTYVPGRAQFHAATAPVSGYMLPAAQTYNTADVVRYNVVPAAVITIILNRGAVTLVDDPTMMLLSGFRSDYNYRTNTPGLSAIEIDMDNDPLFASPTSLVASFGNGAPTDGFGVFSHRNIFSVFSAAATERYIRIRITMGAAGGNVYIGNIWLGAYVDSLATEGWNFGNGFGLNRVDRGRYLELEGGGFSRVQRPSYRRYDLQGRFNRQSWDKFMDAVEGSMDELVDDANHPWAFCFDPTNKMRLVTGKHLHAGLFRVDGSPSARDNGVSDNTGVYFIPDVPLSMRECL